MLVRVGRPSDLTGTEAVAACTVTANDAAGTVTDVSYDDLNVTDIEYQAALQRVADCADEAGGNVTTIGLTIQIGDTTDQPTFEHCQATKLAVIGEARELIKARDRLAGDQN